MEAINCRRMGTLKFSLFPPGKGSSARSWIFSTMMRRVWGGSPFKNSRALLSIRMVNTLSCSPAP